MFFSPLKDIKRTEMVVAGWGVVVVVAGYLPGFKSVMLHFLVDDLNPLNGHNSSANQCES